MTLNYYIRMSQDGESVLCKSSCKWQVFAILISSSALLIRSNLFKLDCGIMNVVSLVPIQYIQSKASTSKETRPISLTI